MPQSTSTEAAERVFENLETDAADAARDIIHRAAQYWPNTPELYINHVARHLKTAVQEAEEYG